jgi:hypothetical protein
LIQIVDVGIDHLKDRASREKTSSDAVHLEVADDLVIKALVVYADGFKGAKLAMSCVIQAKDDFGRGALKNLAVPRRVAFFPEKIPDPGPLLDSQFKGIFPLLVTPLHFFQA